MPLTGLFLLPIQPAQPSPYPSLISHISRSFPAEPLPPYHLDHRLFVDTSSLLPNANTALRRYTHITTLSHAPEKTFIGTSSSPKDATNLTLITIPTSSTESFAQLILTKLQPQWAPRQSLVIDNGTSLSLKDGTWSVRLGDLKLSGGRTNQVAGAALRGVLIEVTYNTSNSTVSAGKAEATEDDFAMVKGFLEALLAGTTTSIASARVLVRDTTTTMDLAGLYMDMLRGSRG